MVFYRDKQEFVGKIKKYLKDDTMREQIAENGYERVMRDGHEAADRVKQVIEDYQMRKRKSDESFC